MNARTLSTPAPQEGPAGGWRALAALAGWVLLAFVPALSGAVAPPGDWYRSLNKPSWNPPGWVFGPVWTCLYASMGVAAWLVWRRGGWAARRRELGWFLVQWVLNGLWTPIFFGLHRPGWALMEMAMLWGAVLMTGLLFWRVHRVAGGLFAPYLAWVSFAAVLNGTLWRLNP